MVGSHDWQLVGLSVLVLADPAPPPLLPSTAALLEELKQSPEGPAQLPLHHRLLEHYWRDVATDGDQDLPEVELLEPGAFLRLRQGTGQQCLLPRISANRH